MDRFTFISIKHSSFMRLRQTFKQTATQPGQEFSQKFQVFSSGSKELFCNVIVVAS